jgi:hypothetical protein
MKFKMSKTAFIMFWAYAFAGIPVFIKYMPILMSFSHGFLEAYPLLVYFAVWIAILGYLGFKKRRTEFNALGLSSLPRTSGRGVHFPREKTWLYKEMPVSLYHPSNSYHRTAQHVECLVTLGGSVVIFWLPRNLQAGLFINNLKKEPKVVMVRAMFDLLLFEATAIWKHILLAGQDPSFVNLRYLGRSDIEEVLHSGELLNRITDLIDFISPLQGRLVIEDSLIALHFPDDLPQGNDLFPRAYNLWHEVAAAHWPRKKFNPLNNRRSCISLIAATAVIVAFITAVVMSLR